MQAYNSFVVFLFIRWVQAECKKLGDTDNPEVSELLKKAVRCLKERPVLFKYCAEEVWCAFYMSKSLLT
jgi:conserved oligomeric Golgi complex subunit 6